MPQLSIIIPSYKDPYLFNTIQSILDNFTGSFEIIPVLDGYVPDRPLDFDRRIRPLFLKQNMGMREAINYGVEMSTAPYIARSDEHCMFGPGFDKIILKNIEPNHIVTAIRYKLNPVAWLIMNEHLPVIYEKLIILDKPHKGIRKFSGVHWKAREMQRNGINPDQTMMMQGSCWIMPRRWWDKVIGRLQTEGYGPLYQDATEMVFKTWKAGGQLMVNKNTWFAHKHRDFNRSHQYPVEKAKPEWLYALNLWKDDYEDIRKKWNV